MRFLPLTNYYITHKNPPGTELDEKVTKRLKLSVSWDKTLFHSVSRLFDGNVLHSVSLA